MRQLPVFLIVLVVLAGGCDKSPTAVEDPEKPSLVISDGAHEGNQHFYFLPPVVPSPSYSGVSDGTLSPAVTVCELDAIADTCGAIVAALPGGESGSELPRYDVMSQSYQVNWHTDQCLTGPCSLDPAKTYRIRVLVGGIELGHADVDVVSNGAGLKNVNTDEFIGLMDGRTLPLKFRIEQGAVSLVESGGSTPLDAAGGQVSLADGSVALTFPAGALAGPTSISVTTVSSPPPGTSEWSPVVELGPDGTTFDQPVTLAIEYQPELLPQGVPGGALMLVTWDGNGWAEVPGSTINAIDNIVSAPIGHFSTYTLSIRPNTVSGASAPTTLAIGQQTVVSGTLWYYHSELQTICYWARSGWSGYRRFCYTTITHYNQPVWGLKVVWSSSNPAVAVLSGSATYTNAQGLTASPLITGLSAGTSQIRGTAAGTTSENLTITVLPPLLPPTFLLSRATSPGVGDLYTMALDGSNSTRLTTVGSINTEPAVSPNGQRIAWRSTRSGSNQIWVMNLDGSSPQQLTTCGYNSDPSWSPDGTRIVYHGTCAGNSDIWVMNADGTAPSRLNTDPSSDGAPDWSPDGEWIAFLSDRLGHNDVWIMKPDGSQPRAVTNDATLDVYLSWSPDARHIAHRCGVSICVSDAFSGTTSTLATGGFGNDTPKWSRDGATIAFQRSHFNSAGVSIWTIPADGSGPEVQVTPAGPGDGHPEWLGPAAPPPPAAYLLARCLAGCDLITVSREGTYPTRFYSDGGLNTEPAISPNGQRVAWRGGGNQILVINRDGSGFQVLTTCGYNSDPSWSPDGLRIAYHSNCSGGNSDVWVMNSDGTNPVRVTTDPASDGTPVWSPDGQWIGFSTNRTGPNDIWIVRPDGTDFHAVTNDAVLDTYLAWSPGSDQIVHTCGLQLCVGSVSGGGTTPLTATGPFADAPFWATDGLISFGRAVAGSWNIWQIRPDGTGLRRLTLFAGNEGHPVRLP